MEHVTCNLCGRDDAKILFGKRDKFGIGENEFNVVECQRCGLLYINPRPSPQEMGRFYPETYSWRETLEAGSSVTRLFRSLEKGYRYHLLKGEVAEVRRLTRRTTGKVLDVGCGTGDRLDVFRNEGFEPFGVETSDSADYAEQFMKLKVFKGDLISASFPERFFDIITLYHVLEHTHDPSEVCREIHRILKEDGVLVIQVPNTESLQFQLFGERWAGFEVPRHLYYFGTKTLRLLLQRAGFEVLEVDHFMNWWHPPTLVISLFPRLDPQRAWAKEGKGGTSLLERIAWILCTLVAGPFTYAESWMRRGAIVTVYAQKQVP